MAEIFVLLSAGAEPVFAWTERGVWQTGPSLSRARGDRKKALAILLDPDIATFAAPLNARSENEARRMAPFAIEDEIAESVENLHVALGDKTELGTPRGIAVIARDKMDDLIAQLQQLGLPDAAIMSASSLLPGEASVVQAGPWVLAKVGDRNFTVDSSFGADLIAGMGVPPETLNVYGERLASSLGVAPAGPGAETQAELLTLLAAWASEDTSAINLRQAPYSVRRELDLSGLAKWRLAGGLAAACAAAYYVLILGQAYSYGVQAETYRETARDYATLGWPQLNGSIDDTIAKIRSGTPAGIDGLSALDATAALYQGLEDVPSVKLQTLRFDRNRDALSAVIVLEEFSDGDALISAMSGLGLEVEIGEARMTGGQLKGELIVRSQQ